MYLRPVSLLLVCALFASCAYQGVVVDKTARELPFSETIGMPGSFAFMLRDSSGAVHRQLVTPEVFTRYQVGDYFNDQQPAPQPRPLEDKVMLNASNASRSSTPRMAKARSSKTSARLASKKTHKSRHRIAAAKRKHSHKSRAASAKRRAAHRAVASAKTSAPKEADLAHAISAR